MPQTDTSPTQRAIALVEQLPADKLTIALTFLENLTQKPDETALLQVIQQQPVLDRPRLENLRDRLEYGDLTPEEHQELMQYEDALERHNVDRIEAIMHLAQLQNIDFPILYQQLTPNHNHATWLLDKDDELASGQWESAMVYDRPEVIVTNPSFAFLNDPEEDIYTLADGKAVS
jgi:hypothetical protein